MDAIVNLAEENRISGWRGPNQYFFEVKLGENKDGDVIYSMKLVFCSDNLSEAQKAGLSDIYFRYTKKDAGSWKTFKTVDSCKIRTIKNTDGALEDYDSLQEQIFKELDTMWSSFQKKLSQIEKQ